MNYQEIQNLFGQPLAEIVKPKTIGRIKREHVMIGIIVGVVFTTIYFINKEEIEEWVDKRINNPVPVGNAIKH